jgi:hypothetical protein
VSKAGYGKGFKCFPIILTPPVGQTMHVEIPRHHAVDGIPEPTPRIEGAIDQG